MQNFSNVVLSSINADALIEQIAERTAEILQRNQPEPQAESIQLLTREEAMTYLRISGATLWRYEKQKKIKSVAIGGKRYFRMSDLENSLK